ncbi:D-alanine--poly(phosphoribitol) ligase [Solihabitans fulvus]|uniref:D-alanine--poly(Phosphoribitol) ligase n=1 Tax=Solihabitans fulvus TaxID=1892852 RepID=A0A5B2XF23_9PSEU|nr:amino acid adenylation domain-containing protein [Solihabitans fulvus]KAA2261402.1 D-alanine--poly(phosphoribitol) ligase [Solihabitans fulvus]
MTNQTLYQWFLASADAHPDHMALEVTTTSLTYAELRATVERMSALMHDTLGGPPRRVGLLTSRSLVGYVSYLAAQRLGATCVPLNPAAAASRNLAITEDAGLDLTVVDDTSGDGAAEYRVATDVPILDMTGGRPRDLLDADRSATIPPGVDRTTDDIAYIIYTSGTTGKPKGVPTTHANVSAFLDDVIPRYFLTPGSRVSQTFEMSFDGSIVEIFGSWGSGATLCVAQHTDVFTPVKFVNAKRLTHWMSVPSLISFAKRLRALAPGSMPNLLGGFFGGEALTMEHVQAWSSAAPKARIFNCYGPTETTVTVTGYQVPLAQDEWVETSNRSIPIGELYPHMEYVLLDSDLLPGEDGELCIRGPQRFPGYLDPSENANRFVSFDGRTAQIYDSTEPLTEDHWYRTGDRVRRERGELVHLGRIDDQIKIRGNRVELGEIESALRKHPDIAEVVVITVTAQDGEMDLHALYTGGEVSDAEFAGLVDQLPQYMHPRGFHHRQEIPLTTVGKVDRKRLSEEFGRIPTVSAR